MRKILWNITWLIIRPLLRIFCGLEVKGLENFQNLKSPLIVAAAIHANYIDSYVLGAALPFNSPLFPIRYMTAPEYIRMPLLGWFIRAYGAYPLEKDVNLEKTLEKSVYLLKEKQAVGVFVEGRLSKDGFFQAIKPGAAFLALKTNLPVLPVGMSGTFGLTLLNFLLRRKKIKVVFGQPIFPAKETALIDKDSVGEFTQLINKKIRELI